MEIKHIFGVQVRYGDEIFLDLILWEGTVSSRIWLGWVNPCSVGVLGWVRKHVVTKKIDFWQKHPLTSSFYGSPPPPTSLGPNRQAQHEGYGGPDLGEKSFQLFSIFIV